MVSKSAERRARLTRVSQRFALDIWSAVGDFVGSVVSLQVRCVVESNPRDRLAKASQFDGLELACRLRDLSLRSTGKLLPRQAVDPGSSFLAPSLNAQAAANLLRRLREPGRQLETTDKPCSRS